MSNLMAVCIIVVSSGTNGDWSEKYWHEMEHCKGQTHAEDGTHHHLHTDYRIYEGPIVTVLPTGRLAPFKIQSLSDARKSCARLGLSGKMACSAFHDSPQ